MDKDIKETTINQQIRHTVLYQKIINDF